MRQARRPAPKTEEERLARIEEAKQKACERSKKYRQKNKEKIKNYQKRHYEENKEKILKNEKVYNSKKETKERKTLWHTKNHKNLKIQAFNILGGCKCVKCGIDDIDILTIDHIDFSGHKERKIGLTQEKLWKAIINKTLPEEKVNNLRVLCWNHNCSRSREYLNLPKNNQTTYQRYQTKLWKEAFDFFGPCWCGISDLRYLTIGHLNDDGAERRRNGEGKGAKQLIQQFKKMGWPESLKEEFAFQCWNHNSGDYFKNMVKTHEVPENFE